MANRVEVVTDLRDRVTRGYTRMGNAVERQNNAMDRSMEAVARSSSKFALTTGKLVTALGGLLILRQINRVVSESIRLFGEQAEAEAKVEQTIKSTGQAAGLTAEQIKEMASELQQLTKFGDETILRGQSMLLTFKEIGEDVFPRATETMLNLAEAMRTDVQTQAIQLGKALNDPITGLTALRRVGITFTEQQEKLIKSFQESGDIAQAQGLILEELESQFGGLARAAAEVGTGPLVQFQNRIGDIREEIGERVLPAVLDMAENLERFLTPDRVDQIADAFGRFAEASSRAGILFGGFIDKYLEWIGAGEEANNVSKDYLNNVGELEDLLGKLTKLQAVLNDETGEYGSTWERLAERDVLGAEIAKIRGVATNFQNVDKILLALQNRYEDLTITPEEKEIVAVKQKFDELRKYYEGNADGLAELAQRQADEILAIQKKFAEDSKVVAEETSLFGPGTEAGEVQARTIQAAQRLQDELAMMAKDGRDLELAKLQDWYNEREQILIQAGENTLLLNAVYKEREEAINEEYREKELEAERKRAQEVDRLRQNAFQGAQRFTSAVSNLARVRGENELKAAQAAGASEETLQGIRKRNFERSQNFAIAQATSNIALGITRAISQGNFLEAAVVGATGAIQLATIKAQKFARGGDFVTNGPQAIIVGDNPGGRERVQVTPLSSPNIDGPQGNTINIGAINISGNNAEEIGDTVQERLRAFAESRDEAEALQL